MAAAGDIPLMRQCHPGLYMVRRNGGGAWRQLHFERASHAWPALWPFLLFFTYKGRGLVVRWRAMAIAAADLKFDLLKTHCPSPFSSNWTQAHTQLSCKLATLEIKA